MPLLFLHGYLSCKESFVLQTEYLSAYFKTVAVDLPGFGRTPEPETPYPLDGYVEFVKRVIDGECGGRAHVIAHSFGGRIALKLSAYSPQRIGRMLLTGCAGMRPRRTLGYLARSYGYKLLKRTSPRLTLRWQGRFASADYMALSPSMRESFKMIVNEHLDGLLPQVANPTLLVFGSEDDQTPRYMARRLKAGIKGSELIVMNGCGHFCFCENAPCFNGIAKEFFL